MIKQNSIFVIILTLMLTNVNAQASYNQIDKNGERHGLWRKTFENSKQLRYEGEFAHGKEIGLFKFYKLLKRKSVLTATKKFNPDNSIAEVTFFTSSGKVISKGKMDGKKYIGEWQYFHNKKEALMTKELYNNSGQLDGEKLIYYENGKIAERIKYVDGKREGVSTWLSLKGIKLKEFTYKNNELHGKAYFYNGQGQLIIDGQYRRDKKHGVWKYYTNGELTDEKDFTYKSKNPKKQ